MGGEGAQQGLGAATVWLLASVSPCQQVNSLPAGQVCGWDRELLHRFIRQNPPSMGGVETSLQKLIVFFLGPCGQLGRSSCRSARGNPR